MLLHNNSLDEMSEDELQEALRAKREAREQKETEDAIQEVSGHLPEPKITVPPAFKATLAEARKQLGAALADDNWYFENIAQFVGAKALEAIYGMNEDQFNDWFNAAITAIEEGERDPNDDNLEGDDDSND